MKQRRDRAASHYDRVVTMRIFLFEYVSGGGMIGSTVPADLAHQGAAMLRGLVADFAATGAMVTTLLEPRARIDWPADGEASVTAIRVSDVATLGKAFEKQARAADAMLLIAPESEGRLYDWSLLVERLGVRHLGSTSRAVAICGDKLKLASHLREAGVPCPVTLMADHAAQLPGGGPVVIKPRWGAGSEATYLLADAADSATTSSPQGMVAQRYVPGMPASVSLLMGEDRVFALPAGEQIMLQQQGRLHYRGGRIPLSKELGARAMQLALRAVQSVSGLRGWFGVDMVLGREPQQDFVIEINARMTMSYLGLRAICRDNLAAMLINQPAVDAPPPRFTNQRVSFDWLGRTQLEGGR